MADGTKDVTVEELSKFLQTIDSADEVRRLKGADTRVTAQGAYDARLEELEKAATPPNPAARAAAAAGATTPPRSPAPNRSAEPETLGKNERRARKRVKYQGKWYNPGDPVPFKAAKDAEPYDADQALVPQSE